MSGLHKTFILDPRLQADTHPLAANDLFDVRLMDDARWPWIIVIPKQADVFDIDELHEGTFDALMQTSADLSRTLKALGVATSTNVATLGNVVAQFHWHIVGRSEGDPGWPGPVWGHGTRQPYEADEADGLIARIREMWKSTASPLRSF